VFAFGGIYAAGTFGMSLSEVIAFGFALNIASGFGAVLFGFVDDRIGGKKTIMVTLVMLSVATAIAVWAPNRTWFWTAGVLIGLFVGPNQSASRSLMGRFVPEKHQTEFFGFFAFSGKVTSFMGPFLLGTVTAAFGSQRAGVATVLLFFLVGGTLLATVNERRGIEAARNG
jgi:UMF1 family MFS transporter